ncbi:MAG: RES family NAD+ phosphorylase [Betaproteobacteria bacterium]
MATTALVDTLDEQHSLERLLEESKPPVPAIARQLHWLLFTPFRYPPPPGGSRFRGPTDAGVFYGADEIRTACAELGYWRWRHLQDTPALAAMPTKPQTLFRAAIAAECVDLRKPPFARDAAEWTRRDNYSACQQFARVAREAGVGAIRYRSVRDPLPGICGTVLSPAAFAPPVPLEQQTWMLSVSRDRVVWQRTGVLQDDEFEFAASAWMGPRTPPAARAARSRRARK